VVVFALVASGCGEPSGQRTAPFVGTNVIFVDGFRDDLDVCANVPTTDIDHHDFSGHNDCGGLEGVVPPKVASPLTCNVR